jgi:hypothetical protein
MALLMRPPGPKRVHLALLDERRIQGGLKPTIWSDPPIT